MTIDGIFDAIRAEAETAEARYGPFRSTHEGFGVLTEEVTELLAAIHANDARSIEREAIQVSAVAARIAESLLDRRTRMRSNLDCGEL